MVSYFKSSNLELPPNHLAIIKNFVKFSMDFMHITSPIRINLVSKSYKNIQSTGSYYPEQQYLNVLCEGRALVDILRTIAHELQHHKQNIEKRIPDNPQDIGGTLENEANIMSGALIKIFVRVFNLKDIYTL